MLSRKESSKKILLFDFFQLVISKIQKATKKSKKKTPIEASRRMMKISTKISMEKFSNGLSFIRKVIG